MIEAIYRCCAGADVHSKTVAVCVRRVDEAGKVHKEIRTFGTMTRDLLGLSDWLLAEGVTHLAMESTGVFWKPIYNILEGQFEIVLVNARHVKNVPGRKTDVKDCEWLAQLLQCGLLRGSFIPALPQRELRDLTRMRKQLTHEMSAVANRIHKVLEDANIKLGLVATDILGVSGRRMIAALIDGETDLDDQLLDGHEAVGLTAGASTPEELVRATAARLAEVGYALPEEITVAKEDVHFRLPKEVART